MPRTPTYVDEAAGQAYVPLRCRRHSDKAGCGRFPHTTCTVDAADNVLTRTQTGANLTIAYDAENRTKSMSGAGGASDYARDADGNQLLRHDATTATLYLPGEELTRTNSTGTIRGTRYYTFSGTEVALRNAATSANPYFVLTDPHGSDQVAAATTSTGIGPVIRRYLDPYGNPLGAVSGGTWPDAHAFVNSPSVPTSGTSSIAPVDDVGAREYEPSTGRFLASDPVLSAGDPQSLNGYAYADNNPIGKSDPTGLRPADDSGGVTGSDLHDWQHTQQQSEANAESYGSALTGGASSGGGAAQLDCLYRTGAACQSPGVQLAEQSNEMGHRYWEDFYYQYQKAVDPCHLNNRCQVQDTLASVSGVKGCFKEHDGIDCASLIPFGKVLKGTELFWDGARWVRQSAFAVRNAEELEHVSEVADKIAAGHAGSKHALDFVGVSRAELSGIIRDTIENNNDMRELGGNRFAFWRGPLQGDQRGSFVVFNPNVDDYGSVYSTTTTTSSSSTEPRSNARSQCDC